MKKKREEKIDAFELARNAPLELSLSEIEGLIQTIPAKIVSQRNSSTDHFFNLKSILMWTIPLALAISVFLFTGNPEEQSNNNEISIKLDTETSEYLLSDYEMDPMNSKSDTEAEELVFEESPKRKINTQLTQIEKADNSGIINTQELTIEKIEIPSNNTTIDDENIDLTWTKRRGATAKTKIEPVPMSDFSNRALRKLKKTLFRELQSDGVIPFAPMAVEISLLGDVIMVNDVQLEDKLFIKYAELTSKVGSGPDRNIKINHDYVLVGDFTDDGFSGHGLGTFQGEEMNSPDSPLFGSSPDSDPELFIKQEMNERDLFSEVIVNNVGPLIGAKRKRGVDLDYKKCHTLHKELYNQLIKDGLVKDTKQYVVLQLPGSKVLINGQAMSKDLLDVYNDLLAAYKIKDGAYRMIRLSEHTISVGDYIGGSFTGTTTTLMD